MHRKFIAFILAAAVAVTGLAAPAQAGNKELSRLLLGVATVGIIAAAIEDSKRRDKSHSGGHVTRQQPYYPPVVHAPPRGHNGHSNGYNNGYNNGQNYGHVAPRPLPDRARDAVLPSQCLQTVSDRRGSRHVYSAGCLQRSNVRVGNLPDRCALTVVGQQGRARTAYDAGCLGDYGYRSARR